MTSRPLRAIRAAAAPLAIVAAAAVLVGAAAPRRGAPRVMPRTAPVISSPAILPVPLNPVIPPALRVCTSTAPSGVGTRVLKPGSAAKPAPSDIVLVNYIGYLAATGAVFDQNKEASFPVQGVIKGFGEGLQGMGRGGITRICIPAALGYGPRAAGSIPPNSGLVFQVELVDFKTAAEVQAMQQQAEQAAGPAPTTTPPPPPAH